MQIKPSTYPRTVVVHHRSGIGDLIWHIPYLRAIAAKSLNGKISIIAKPSCLATQVLAAEVCIEEIFEFDYRPRQSENRKGKQDSLLEQLAFAKMLKNYDFERIVNFSPRVRYNLIALYAGIPERIGFGLSFGERLTLNSPPYIKKYQGNGNWVYSEATNLMISHKFVSAAVLPKMTIRPSAILAAKTKIPTNINGLIAFSIGTSEEKKQWGLEKFTDLAAILGMEGYAIVLLGGASETVLAQKISQNLKSIPADIQIIISTNGSIQDTAALLKLSKVCVGNDTGVLNMSLACDTPAIGLFGASRVPELNDPLLKVLAEDGMANISVKQVVEELKKSL